MYLKSIFSKFIKAKNLSVLSAIIFLICFISSPMNLEAGGWGKTEEVINYEKTTWNNVFFDMNGLHLEGLIPNYYEGILQNNLVTLRGGVKDNIKYVIISPISASFTPPKTVQEFAKIVQEANPTYLISVVKAENLGAKFAIDLIPTNPDEFIFWRLLCAEDRVVKTGTNDPNEKRRTYFFDNLFIN